MHSARRWNRRPGRADDPWTRGLRRTTPCRPHRPPSCRSSWDKNISLIHFFPLGLRPLEHPRPPAVALAVRALEPAPEVREVRELVARGGRLVALGADRGQ